jgi:hypothetical protein
MELSFNDAIDFMDYFQSATNSLSLRDKYTLSNM